MTTLRFIPSRRLLKNGAVFCLSVLSSSLLSYQFFALSADMTAAAANRTVPNPVVDIPKVKTKGTQTAVLAGGCFWGVEAVFEHLKGVTDVVSGYAGGNSETANYDRVSSGQTGHAEAVKISYDPSQISYGQLLKVYFAVAHDPTQLNRQGPDRGTQYRSAIFFVSDQQKKVAQAYVDQLNKVGTFSQPVVTQIVPFKTFYPAEQYHQDFIVHNPNYPYVVVHDLPKLKQLQKQFPELYKTGG